MYGRRRTGHTRIDTNNEIRISGFSLRSESRVDSNVATGSVSHHAKDAGIAVARAHSWLLARVAPRERSDLRRLDDWTLLSDLWRGISIALRGWAAGPGEGWARGSVSTPVAQPASIWWEGILPKSAEHALPNLAQPTTRLFEEFIVHALLEHSATATKEEQAQCICPSASLLQQEGIYLELKEAIIPELRWWCLSRLVVDYDQCWWTTAATAAISVAADAGTSVAHAAAPPITAAAPITIAAPVGAADLNMGFSDVDPVDSTRDRDGGVRSAHARDFGGDFGLATHGREARRALEREVGTQRLKGL